jgi:hypothetical protein
LPQLVGFSVQAGGGVGDGRRPDGATFRSKPYIIAVQCFGANISATDCPAEKQYLSLRVFIATEQKEMVLHPRAPAATGASFTFRNRLGSPRVGFVGRALPIPPAPRSPSRSPGCVSCRGFSYGAGGLRRAHQSRRISKGEGKSIGPNSISLSSWSRSVVGTFSCPAPPPTPSYIVLLVSHWSHLNDLVGRYGRHSAPSAITWLGWHHCPGWHSNGAAAVPQLHFHAVGWPTAQAGITCISLCPRTCLAWATPIDMAIASSATQQVFSMSRPPCAAKTLLYRAAKFLGNRS